MSEEGGPSINVTGEIAQKDPPLTPPLKRNRFEDIIDKTVDETGKKKIADIVKAAKDGL